jgi:prevent-host-death family protein
MRVSEDIVPIAEFKATLSDTVRSLSERARPLIVTLNGKPAAVVMSPHEYDRLTYQLRLMKGITEGLADDAAGRTITQEEMGRRLESRFAKLRKARSAK